MHHILPDTDLYLDISSLCGLLNVRYIGVKQFIVAKEKDHFREPVPRSVKGSQQIGAAFIDENPVNIPAK